MRKLLLLASLCALAIPAAASAHEPLVLHRPVLSSFGLSIVVREAPKVTRHQFQLTRHLRPQPWSRHFQHHAPRFDGHKPWRLGPRHFDRHWGRSWRPGPHFDRRWDGDRRWSGGHDRQWGDDRRWSGRGDHGRQGRSFDHGRHDGRRR
jgi:hypothetical protein